MHIHVQNTEAHIKPYLLSRCIAAGKSKLPPCPECLTAPIDAYFEKVFVMAEDEGVLYPDVYGRLDDARGYLRRALARNLGVPAGQLTLAEGGLLTRLGEGPDGPLRFDLEID